MADADMLLESNTAEHSSVDGRSSGNDWFPRVYRENAQTWESLFRVSVDENAVYPQIANLIGKMMINHWILLLCRWIFRQPLCLRLVKWLLGDPWNTLCEMHLTKLTRNILASHRSWCCIQKHITWFLCSLSYLSYIGVS